MILTCADCERATNKYRIRVGPWVTWSELDYNDSPIPTKPGTMFTKKTGDNCIWESANIAIIRGTGPSRVTARYKWRLTLSSSGSTLQLIFIDGTDMVLSGGTYVVIWESTTDLHCRCKAVFTQRDPGLFPSPTGLYDEICINPIADTTSCVLPNCEDAARPMMSWDFLTWTPVSGLTSTLIADGIDPRPWAATYGDVIDTSASQITYDTTLRGGGGSCCWSSGWSVYKFTVSNGTFTGPGAGSGAGTTFVNETSLFPGTYDWTDNGDGTAYIVTGFAAVFWKVTAGDLYFAIYSIDFSENSWGGSGTHVSIQALYTIALADALCVNDYEMDVETYAGDMDGALFKCLNDGTSVDIPLREFGTFSSSTVTVHTISTDCECTGSCQYVTELGEPSTTTITTEGSGTFTVPRNGTLTLTLTGGGVDGDVVTKSFTVAEDDEIDYTTIDGGDTTATYGGTTYTADAGGFGGGAQIGIVEIVYTPFEWAYDADTTDCTDDCASCDPVDEAFILLHGYPTTDADTIEIDCEAELG